jgi:acyl carrier protein
VAPQDEMQKTIVAIWRELLQVERVGLDDSFFDLGGHSLLIVQAQRRLREVTDRELSITDMFRYPTVRALAQHLGQEARDGKEITAQESADRADARREAMMRRRQRRQRARRDTTE